MVKYSSFLLIASLWVFTVLFIRGASVVSASGDPSVTDADPFNGNIKTAAQALSQIETTSNPFVSLFRDTAKKFMDSFEKDKQFIQDAVTKGTEMEKKIQSISLTLKNSTVTLPTELQSELEGIEKNAAAELKKLKGVEDIKDIEEMHKRYKEKYTEFKKQVKVLADLALSVLEKDKAKKDKAPQVKVQQVNAHTLQVQTSKALVAEVQNQEESISFVEKAKKLLIEFIKTFVPLAITMKKDTDANYKKKSVASSALSNIRDELIKVEQIQYHFLRASKDIFKTDAAPSVRLSMVQFSIAIMFGMLF